MISAMRSLLVLLVALATASPVAVAQALDPDEEAARRHFERGLTHYDAGEYQEALAEFDAVKRFHDSPALDYNVARCYDRLERYQEAIAAYERYVSQKPDAPDAAATRERIATLRSRLAPPPEPPARAAPTSAPPTPAPPAAAPAPATAAPAPTPVDNGAPRRSSLRRFAAPIAIGAGALAAAAIGAGLLGSVKSDYDAALGPSGCRPCSNDQIAPLEHRAIAGYALLGVGGALVVVDVALIAVLVARGKKSSGAHAQLSRRWQ